VRTLQRIIRNSLLAFVLALAFVRPALPAEPGQLKWSSATGGAAHACPALGLDGTLYIGSQDGNFYALDAVTGARRWTFYGNFAMSMSSAAVDEEGTVYFAKYDVGGARVHALDGATGTKKWTFAYDHTVPGYSSPAVGADGTV
jgi:outer membrane protein assembly factor BamB